MTRDEARAVLAKHKHDYLDTTAGPLTVPLNRQLFEAILTLLLADDGTRSALGSVFVEDPSEAREPNGGHALPVEEYSTERLIWGDWASVTVKPVKDGW
jgi:hypothetical protein